MNITNEIWKDQLKKALEGFEVKPRGLLVKENIAQHYSLPMPGFLSHKLRNVNYNFMFAEAAWIISGSNRLNIINKYMKSYGKFSDDQVFMRGAYGPKVVDQLGYIVDTLYEDQYSRQAVMNIWRERPGPSKDIPCTTNIQFIIRDNNLNAIVTMRSQDIVLGFTYDVFTFSMIAEAVKLLLLERNRNYNLGRLYVNVGSLHIYENHFAKARQWIHSSENMNNYIIPKLNPVLNSKNYEDLIYNLWLAADEI